MCCDYVHRRSPGGRLRGCCGERGRFGRDPGVVEGRQDGEQRHIRRPFHRRRHRHRHLRRHHLRHYCAHRRMETTHAYLSEIKYQKKYYFTYILTNNRKKCLQIKIIIDEDKE